MTEFENNEQTGTTLQQRIWILVDHSVREKAFENVAKYLAKKGVETQIVTITEVIGSVARDAITGGAERLLRGLRVAIQGRSVDEDLIGAVRRARPDMLVVTNPRYGRALGLLESLTGIPSLQMGVLPDYNLSPQWLNSSVAGFIVPHAEHQERLTSLGFAQERVFVAGPPIQASFEQAFKREDLRAEFGFGDSTIVLVRADSFEPSVLEKLVFQATLVERDVKFLFHHNGDAVAASTLRRAAGQYGLPASMFGKVSDLVRYVVASDAVMTAPSEPYLAELLATHCPLLFVGLDENYASQLDFLVRHGAARHVVDILRLGSELERFCDDESLKAISEASTNLATSDATAEVANVIHHALEHIDAWRSDTVRTQTRPSDATESQDSEASVAETPEAPKGPFEPIGAPQTPSREPTADGASKLQHTPGPEFAPGISQSEAREQLAQLILVERDLERRLEDAQRQQKRWRNRLELAREWNEESLAREAESVLRNFIEEATPLEEELADIRRQKEKLKQAARERRFHGSGAPTEPVSGYLSNDAEDRVSKLERRFQDMEVESDLEGLKDRIKRELGE